MDLNTTFSLARFVVNARAEDMPPALRHEAKRSLLNLFACALAGCRDVTLNKLIAVLGAFTGPREATVIGRSERFDILNAAFLNAASGNVFDFDDTHLRTVIHPTSPVAPALLAWAERTPTSGEQLLHAFALGVEVECRIGNAISPWHYNHGWHITSTCGVFGSAAAIGKLIGLDATQMVWALGNAAVQSAGLVEGLGVMAKSVSVGNAARNGIVAALLAREGFTGPEHPIEGRHGFANVMGSAPQFNEVIDGLGDTWELMQNAYKPYPCGVVLHPVIDACLALRAKVDASDIAKVVVRGNPLLRVRADRKAPATGRLAQVSAQHSVAVAFIDGRAGLAQYTDARVKDTKVLALGAKVEIVDDGTVPVEAAHVSVGLRDGRTLTEHVPHALGSMRRPMTDVDIEGKCRDLAAIGAPHCNVDGLIDAIWKLDAIDAARPLRFTIPGR
ncbi:MAG: MmgE/PrpD family protein [Burkholderiales bacterium]